MTNTQTYARRLHRQGRPVRLALGGVTVWHHRISRSTFGFATYEDRELARWQVIQHATILGYDCTFTTYRDVQNPIAAQVILWKHRSQAAGGYHFEQAGTRVRPSFKEAR